MQQMLSDPLTLAVLALLVGQSLIFLVTGIRKQRQQRRSALSENTRTQTRLELVAWGVLPPSQNPKAPAVRALVRGWLGITAWGRIGMGVGILLGGGVMFGVLALLSASVLLSPLTPPDIQAVTLLLQGYAFGMCAGAALGLLLGASRARPPSLQAAAPARPTVKLAEYRVFQVAILPGVLLALDVILVGGFDLLFLLRFSQVQLWSLAIFPGLLLLICALGAWFTRRLAQLPLRLTDDPALAARAENRLRSWLVGMLLEREVFALFILVASQWLLQSFSQAQPGNLHYIAVLPIYAIVLLSMRGLLERAQQDLNNQT